MLLPKLIHHLFKTISPVKAPEKGSEGDDLEKYEVKLEQQLFSEVTVVILIPLQNVNLQTKRKKKGEKSMKK